MEQADSVVYIQSPWNVETANTDEERYGEFMSQVREQLFSEQDDLDLTLEEEKEEAFAQEANANKKGTEHKNDMPRVINHGTHEDFEKKKRQLYGAESWRVLELAENQGLFFLIKLISLLNSICYPILALMTIKLQLLYFRYSYHQDSDKLTNTFEVYLMSWDYQQDKLILIAIFGGTLAVSVLLQILQKTLYANTSYQMEETLRK